MKGDDMKFVLIFGPHAVGKMTVGQELAGITGLKLFHNHMTIDLVANFFSYGTEQGRRSNATKHRTGWQTSRLKEISKDRKASSGSWNPSTV